jgi:hypothetical protein
MVTLGNFKKLDYEVQLHFLYGSGVNLELYRTINEQEVVLYSLGNFYVEIYFNSQITRVLQLKPFHSVKKLEPYLPNVDISEIEGFLRKINC